MLNFIKEMLKRVQKEKEIESNGKVFIDVENFHRVKEI